MLIGTRRRNSPTNFAPFLFIFLLSFIILNATANPSQFSNRRSIQKETRIQGDVNEEGEAKMDGEEHKGHKDCSKHKEENEGGEEIGLSKRGNGRRNSEMGKALMMDDGGTTVGATESTTVEWTTKGGEPPLATMQAAPLEFDTFAPGFFPSSPGFSEEETKSTTIQSNLEEKMEKKGEKEEMIFLDSTNRTMDGEENEAKNGSRFWEFERVEIGANETQNIGTENATILANIARDNETLKAEDGGIIGTTEAAILDRDIEQWTTPFEAEEAMESSTAGKMGKEKLGKRPEETKELFGVTNSTEIGCDEDASHSHEAAEITQEKTQKNATKEKKPTETEFFAGVDELNDDKENRVAEEVEERRLENSEWGIEKGRPKGVPELAVEIGINATLGKKGIQLVVDRAVTTEKTRTTLGAEGLERTTTTAIKWTPYTFDCADEVDDRGELLCQEWAKGGLCEINKATRFLFCRRTCLCIGFQK